MQWYLDAWAVRDGLAFASYRAPGDIQHAERTIFLSVPGLEAVPTGRVSTALWATRANFQDGLHTEEGDEIGFVSIAQLKELVRRGYLAGGIGPGPAGQPPAPLPPLRDGPTGGQLLDASLAELDLAPGWPELSKGIAAKGKREQCFGELLSDDWIARLVAHLRAFAEASIVTWARQIGPTVSDSARVIEYAQWIHLLHATGLWESDSGFLDEIDGMLAMNNLRLPRPSYYRRDSVWSWQVVAAGNVFEQIVFHAPCPLRSTWDPRIRTVSDKLLLAVVTADYFDRNDQLAEFVPALLAALVVVQARMMPFGYGSSGLGRQKIETALSWLSEQMPQVELPAVAEKALSQFAWNSLDPRERQGEHG